MSLLLVKLVTLLVAVVAVFLVEGQLYLLLEQRLRRSETPKTTSSMT